MVCASPLCWKAGITCLAPSCHAFACSSCGVADRLGGRPCRVLRLCCHMDCLMSVHCLTDDAFNAPVDLHLHVSSSTSVRHGSGVQSAMVLPRQGPVACTSVEDSPMVCASPSVVSRPVAARRLALEECGIRPSGISSAFPAGRFYPSASTSASPLLCQRIL